MATMSDVAPRSLWCLIDGESTPFKVIAPLNTDIYNLKELVREMGKNRTLRNVLAKDLVLWKVCMLQSPAQML